MKLPTNTNKEAPCPSSRTEQGQISCAHLGYPVFTNYLQSSPTETTAHSCQPKAHIHSPTLPLHSHIPFAIQKLHSRKENSLKLTGLPGLINWTAEAYCGSGHGVGVAFGVRTSAQTGEGLAQSTHQNKSSRLQQGPLLGKSKK